MVSWAPAAWRTASSRCAATPRAPPVPLIAAMRSIHTAVGWFAILLPPGSAFALAAQSGLTYCFAPTYGLSTRLPGFGLPEVVVVVVEVDGCWPVHTVPFKENDDGSALLEPV